MVFHTSKRNVIYPNLKVNNNNIEKATEFNFLSVILDSQMTWNKHINHNSMKIARFDLTLFSKIYTCSTDNDVTYIIMSGIAQESSIYLISLWSFHNKITDENQ